MAKESMKAREVKRAKLVAKYAEKRAALKKIVNSGDPSGIYIELTVISRSDSFQSDTDGYKISADRVFAVSGL